MILCLCKAVTDREVDDAIRRGARTVDAIGETCGAGTDCGSCVHALEKRIACHGSPATAQRSPGTQPSSTTGA